MNAPMQAHTQTLAGRRILIIEEALRTTTGHFFEYDRAVKEASEARGAVAVVAGHAAMDDDVRKALSAEAAFPRTCWEIGFGAMGPLRRQCEIVRHNAMFYRTVRKLLRSHGPFDVVFAPTVTIYHAPAMALLARTVPTAQAGRFVSFFRNSVGVRDSDGVWHIDRLKGAVWRRVFRSLEVSAQQGRSAQVTDSSRLAEEYAVLTGGALTVLPHPAMTVRDLVQQRDFDLTPFTFGHLGPPRLEKGVDIFLDAIGQFLDARPNADVRFLVQWNQPLYGADGRAVEPDAALEADPRVTFIRDPMDSEAYLAQLKSIDCMVLPYRRDAYASRISGIAVEAATAGQCLIVSEDTWLSDLMCEHGHGLTVPDGDITALAAAMAQIFDNRQAMAARGRERGEPAQAFHSSNRFINLLWRDG